MFGIIFSILVGVVFYAGLADQGVGHTVALAIGLGVALISSFVFHAWLAWEDSSSGYRQYHARKIGKRRR